MNLLNKKIKDHDKHTYETIKVAIKKLKGIIKNPKPIKLPVEYELKRME